MSFRPAEAPSCCLPISADEADGRYAGADAKEKFEPLPRESLADADDDLRRGDMPFVSVHRYMTLVQLRSFGNQALPSAYEQRFNDTTIFS